MACALSVACAGQSGDGPQGRSDDDAGGDRTVLVDQQVWQAGQHRQVQVGAARTDEHRALVVDAVEAAVVGQQQDVLVLHHLQVELLAKVKNVTFTVSVSKVNFLTLCKKEVTG